MLRSQNSNYILGQNSDLLDQVTCAKGKIDNEMKNNSLLHIISVNRQLHCKKSASTCTVNFTGACILFAVIITHDRAV